MDWEELPAEAWRGYQRPGFPAESWDDDNGVLRARGESERIDLISRNTYRNFVLSLEWRLPAKGNSGILYHVSEASDAAWQSGPEMQLLDDREHPDCKRPETRCGALYDLLAPEQGFFPADPTFKTAQLIVKDDRVEHWLNGMRVLSYSWSDPALRSKVAGSKFRDLPAFAQCRDGHLVLQHHGSDAWFRNVRIQKLS
ncbi:DUF1080 domain-containing protein [Proteobacteria bacterium 005FR1]|nr:DUF1080 domain-containing protein [Proteobacteria bacterium 005FR1]